MRVQLPSLLLCAQLAAPLATQSADAALQKRVDQYLAPLVAQGLFSGSVLLARGDKILVQHGYGSLRAGEPAANTPATKFNLLSISKTIATFALMRLVQDGKLKLQDPVRQHLPDLPPTWNAVTLHDLLDHTSGIPDLQLEWQVAQERAGRNGRTAWAALAAAMRDRPLLTQPGTTYSYSNFNIELIGLVLDFQSGLSYREFLQQAVLDPLGMTSTGFDDGQEHPGLASGHELTFQGEAEPTRKDMSFLLAACGLHSTVGDLHRFARALLDPKWLLPATHRLMVTPRQGTYACGWINQPVHGRPCFRHSGGLHGYSNDCLRFPDDDATVLVLGNLAYAPTVRIAEDLAAMLLRQKHPTPQRPDAAALARCAGIYRSADGSHVALQRYGDKLVAFLGTEPFRGYALLPIGAAAFAEPVAGDVRMEFDRAQGKRLMRIVRGTSTVLSRVDPPLDRWRALAGPLVATPDLGVGVRLVASESGLSLQIEGRAPAPVLPVDDNRAIALHEVLRGAWLRRDGDALLLQLDGVPFRFARPAAR